jgi:hypothetical protein
MMRQHDQKEDSQRRSSFFALPAPHLLDGTDRCRCRTFCNQPHTYYMTGPHEGRCSNERLTMTYIALAAIATGLVLFDRLCPKIQECGSPYNWSTPLRVLTDGHLRLPHDLGNGHREHRPWARLTPAKCVAPPETREEPHGIQARFSRKFRFQVQREAGPSWRQWGQHGGCRGRTS